METDAKTVQPKPSERLKGMRKMFEKDGGVLAEDYQFFTRQEAPSPLSKGRRKSEEPSGPPVPKRS